MSRFKAIRKPLRAFLTAQAATTAGLALGVAAVVALAGAADGHAPEATALLRVTMPSAAFGGLAFTMARWRAQAGDVALAGLGLRPAAVWLSGVALAAGLCALAPRRAALASGERAGATLSVSTTAVVAEAGEQTVRLDFGPDGARRSDRISSWAALPAPTGATERPTPWRPPGLLWLALAAALGLALDAGVRAPGLTRTLGTVGGSLALAWALGL